MVQTKEPNPKSHSLLSLYLARTLFSGNPRRPELLLTSPESQSAIIVAVEVPWKKKWQAAVQVRRWMEILLRLK
ncbi:hypothetical protein LOK49_LG02G03008 [Camellia lanceoleosa]|uniref:Uncharacterized protein n=1 Tax=Camellia lanceoleosa TaxID=1840588 RepID=A0ACC0IQ63_9ERIC|nr:hypothetical protein LOK49_LG02G03008 [Camellia lanceoleosa]